VPERPPDSATQQASGEGSDSPDLGRRRFFRQFAGEIISGAASVVGAAAALQRSSAEAARGILDPETGAQALATAAGLGGPTGSAAAAAGVIPGAAGGPAGFRTPFRMDGDELVLIDQRRLPDALVEVRCSTSSEVVAAIRDMVVRGAPALGQVAAIGMALAAYRARQISPVSRRASVRGAASALRRARPTAVNIGWAVDRMLRRFEELSELSDDGVAIADGLRAEADAIVFEATDDHGRLAEAGLALLPEPDDRPLRLLTHCNTGPLAAGQFGTALGVVQAAHHAGRRLHVYVDETRPYLQGARLTAWELTQAGVPHTLVVDAAAGWLMANGMVDAIVVGADRIAANGDTANKIGTYPLAVLAARHGVPFYFIAPLSSVDLATPDGSAIPIEQRPTSEVLLFRGQLIAPPHTGALNPAFDITPAELITAIVTEEGALHPPYGPALAAAVEAKAARRVPPPPFAGFEPDPAAAPEPAPGAPADREPGASPDPAAVAS
jgi:methylthioribose-1-phosphate isomerase